MKYIHSNNYDKTRLLEVLSLDDIVYEKKYRGTFESVSQRYKTNEEMFIFAVDDENRMCGYICFFPVSSELTERIENESIMFDDNIEPKDVRQYDKNSINNIFLISIAVFPEYKRKGVGFGLVKEMFAFLGSLSASGYEIGKIFAITTSLEGEKVLSKFNFEKKRLYENNIPLLKCDFVCHKNMDLYLFFPVALTSSFSRSKASNPFLEKLIETSKLEVNSLMNERLERTYLGKVRFAPEDDYGNAVYTKILEADLYISSYRNIATLIAEFPSISFDPTFVLDQSSRNSLKVIVNGVEQPLFDYLSLLGLNVLGNCTHLLVSAKKLSPYYRQFVLFGESYINRIGSKIVSKEAKVCATTNIAQYEFAEIYCSSVGVIFEFDSEVPSLDYQTRLQTSILMIYINEILALQIASLKLVQNAITSEFDNSPKPSLEIIENLIDSFGKYIVLFDYNYKYDLARCLSDNVSQRFGIAAMRSNYEKNVEQLNKIVTIRSERLNKQFSKKQDTLFNVISIFTLLISINNVISLFVGRDFSNTTDLIVFIISIAVWVGAVIYLLVIWIKKLINKTRSKSTALKAKE